jgi:predicted nucleic acid-binding protein
VILVDKSVWVRATRQKDGSEAQELDSLLDRDEVATTDVVVVEVLQGTANEAEFERYSDEMEGLHYFPVTRATWLKAAELSCRLRREGAMTALADMEIATVALENDLEVYAVDADFSQVPGLRRTRWMT